MVAVDGVEVVDGEAVPRAGTMEAAMAVDTTEAALDTTEVVAPVGKGSLSKLMRGRRLRWQSRYPSR